MEDFQAPITGPFSAPSDIDSGLITSLLNRVPLRADHAFAISSQTQRLLANESTFDQAADLLCRLNQRTNDETPLRIRLEIHLAEEDLHRHRGNFDAAIAARQTRVELEQNPLVSCYERSADSDNRHAAALYDAHRLCAAVECLTPWLKKFGDDPKVCLPETRAKLLNTLARCLVVTGDPRWESLFQHSLLIQKMADPCNVSVTTNFLAHGYLKSRRVDDAKRVLDIQDKESDPFRIWLAAECARQSRETWENSQCESVKGIDATFHPYGFACQAIARQVDRSDESRLRFLEKARDSFEQGLDHDVSNVKRVLSACCTLAIAVVTGDALGLTHAINDFRQFSAKDGFNDIRDWYEPYIATIERERSWPAVDSIFSRVPHL